MRMAPTVNIVAPATDCVGCWGEPSFPLPPCTACNTHFSCVRIFNLPPAGGSIRYSRASNSQYCRFRSSSARKGSGSNLERPASSSRRSSRRPPSSTGRCSASGRIRGPLSGAKRTLIPVFAMSASDPKRTCTMDLHQADHPASTTTVMPCTASESDEAR
jgi:hypothetical protein